MSFATQIEILLMTCDFEYFCVSIFHTLFNLAIPSYGI